MFVCFNFYAPLLCLGQGSVLITEGAAHRKCCMNDWLLISAGASSGPCFTRSQGTKVRTPHGSTCLPHPSPAPPTPVRTRLTCRQDHFLSVASVPPFLFALPASFPRWYRVVLIGSILSCLWPVFPTHRSGPGRVACGPTPGVWMENPDPRSPQCRADPGGGCPQLWGQCRLFFKLGHWGPPGAARCLLEE